MAWTYELRERLGGEARWPTCPACLNIGTVVWLKDDLYCCLAEYPYRAFEAVWEPDPDAEEEAP